MYYEDRITGYIWRPTSSADHVVLASKLSQFYNGGAAVDPAHRYPWCTANPESLWIGTYDSKAEIVVQLHALARPLQEIWQAGRVCEADKTEHDVLGIDAIQSSARPLQWYLELAVFHHQALDLHHSLAREGLKRGVAGIIATLRGAASGDELLKLHTKGTFDDDISRILFLNPSGILSPQKRYPLLQVNVEELSQRHSRRFDQYN